MRAARHTTGSAPSAAIRCCSERSGGATDVDYSAVYRRKTELVAEAHRAFLAGSAEHLRSAFTEFREQNKSWLDDLALFLALREHHGGASWTQWPAELRRREPDALREWAERLAEQTERHAFAQFLFARQWSRIREHARQRGVRIIGDVPIFVAHDSADVWAQRELFRVDEEGSPEVVSGVPPDYFSETGQRWGNPLYRWDVMRSRGYRWWKSRFSNTLAQVDIVRIDHFRGFEAFWEIPADEETAVNGEWREGPGAELFEEVERALGALPLIAEDLGLITEEVEELRDRLELPGMRVLQFDGDPTNPHLPANYVRRAVAYPGTHDNDTIAGWWSSAKAEERAQAKRLLDDSSESVHWALLRLVWQSQANWAIAQVQDVLGLDSSHRMNQPGTSAGNWAWRLDPAGLTPELQTRLLRLTRESDRLPHNENESKP
jgi:4-alpha-glucanotransferase